jgi:hypothetical protein
MAASDDLRQLRACADRGDAEGTATVLSRLGHSPEVTDSLNAALVVAAHSESVGHTEVVRVLLADGRADPAWQRGRALLYAVFQGPLDTVRLLLADARVDPRMDGSIPLCAAAKCLRYDVVQRLLDDGRADPAALFLDMVAPLDTTISRLLLADGRVDVCFVARHFEPIPPVLRAALCWRRRRSWLRALAVGI